MTVVVTRMSDFPEEPDTDTIVTCPAHSSQFDVTTGKLMSGPVELSGPRQMFTGCPEKVKKTVAQMFEGIAEEQRLIKDCTINQFMK